MKRNFLLILLMLPLIVLPLLPEREWLPPSSLRSATSLGDGGDVAGRIRIPERGIYAEVYTTDHGPDCGCCGALWNGGTVTVTADLSSVQVGDMAEIYTVEGEHLVLECIEIRKNSRGMETNGDVLVINGRWVYRLTRL